MWQDFICFIINSIFLSVKKVLTINLKILTEFKLNTWQKRTFCNNSFDPDKKYSYLTAIELFIIP